MLYLKNIMHWTTIEQVPSLVSSIRSNVYNVVRIGYNVEIVLNNHNSIPLLHQALQNFQ